MDSGVSPSTVGAAAAGSIEGGERLRAQGGLDAK
jgi:hypothetical protein